MTCTDCCGAWYLAQLKPNCQRLAEVNLNRQGFHTFLPQREETRRTRTGFATTARPLFPGYIFVAFEAARGGWRAINATYGITRLVSVDNRPQPVPQDIIVELKQRCDAGGKMNPGFQARVGDHVRIAVGPFADFMARVEKMAPDKRIWVLLDLMGRETRLRVPANALQAVSGR